jgi:hypothetical protein
VLTGFWSAAAWHATSMAAAVLRREQSCGGAEATGTSSASASAHRRCAISTHAASTSTARGCAYSGRLHVRKPTAHRETTVRTGPAKEVKSSCEGTHAEGERRQLLLQRSGQLCEHPSGVHVPVVSDGCCHARAAKQRRELLRRCRRRRRRCRRLGAAAVARA